MPQPIDVQTELARITTMERVQQISDRLSLAAHKRLSDQAERQQVDAQTQTQQAEQKNEQVDKELRRRNPYAGRRRAHKDGDSKNEDAAQNPTPRRGASDLDEHHLDVSV